MTLTISFLSLAAFVWFSSPILFAFTRLNSIGKSFGENCREWTCEWVNNKNTWLYIMILKGNTSTQYQFNSFPLRKLSFTLGDVTLRVIEDITWLRGDTKFLFECWKIFHEWAQRTSEIFSTRVKVSCFPVEAHLVFHWCLYNKIRYCTVQVTITEVYFLSDNHFSPAKAN